MSKRHKIFFILVGVIFSAVLCRMIILAGSQGEVYRQSASSMACKSGRLSAIRGRIFDKNDKLLAWSERCYDLVLQELPADQKRVDFLKDKLEKAMLLKFPEILAENQLFPVVIKYNLTANELAAADMLAEKYSEFDVSLRWERRCAASPPELGEVRQNDGMEEGISGWEKEFDDILSGTPGTFTVMLDRHGRWVNSTFRIVTPPKSGKDVYLSEELPEQNDE